MVCASQDIQRHFVYLAYLDDSGTRQKDQSIFQVLSAVIIRDTHFSNIEVLMGAALDLLPPENLEKFEEFHAWEIFGGHGAFEGIPQERRFELIKQLLDLIDKDLPVVYGAVNREFLNRQLWASADPVDIAFRICAKGIDKWVRQHSPNEFAILIADDGDSKIKSLLKKSFRQMRKPIRPPHWELGELQYVHDDMYFGSSKDSVGIQLADLCSYFIGKHLQGDPSGEGFYDMISPHIVHHKIEPEAKT